LAKFSFSFIILTGIPRIVVSVEMLLWIPETYVKSNSCTSRNKCWYTEYNDLENITKKHMIQLRGIVFVGVCK
jgi:hypothetical protein